MKNLVFNYIADTGEGFLAILKTFFGVVISAVTVIANYVIDNVAHAFRMVLWLIDPDRMDHADEVVSQMSLNNELEILMNVTRVKEDALNRKAWTSHHSLALNELSSKLYNECEWNKDRIHEYMRTIVESIPGLSYAAADDDYDEDDDSIDLDD